MAIVENPICIAPPNQNIALELVQSSKIDFYTYGEKEQYNSQMGKRAHHLIRHQISKKTRHIPDEHATYDISNNWRYIEALEYKSKHKRNKQEDEKVKKWNQVDFIHSTYNSTKHSAI